jgi:hypothetical protein
VNVCADALDAGDIDSDITSSTSRTDTVDSGANSSELTDGLSSDSGITDGGFTGMWPDGAPLECCPMSDQVSVCMDLGGAKLFDCATVCDGIAAGDWSEGVDRYGCPIWIEPPADDSGAGSSSWSRDAAPNVPDASLDAAP